MRILHRDYNGIVILNPPQLKNFVEGSPQKAIAVVLAGKNLIAATSFIDHSTMIGMAGMEVDNLDLTDAKPETATLRGGMTAEKINLDIWIRSDDVRAEDYATEIEQVYDFVVSHDRFRRMGDDFEVQLDIYDADYVLTHSFDNEGLWQEDQSSRNLLKGRHAIQCRQGL